ncbi:ATP-dependent RNA helicase dbp6 [Arthroderma uncinatum]|uniref:ATP-dependent RNA helicase dbp6 n=1 Tax=Arthroderma uncinatum TaxID=74035 RepID=UPI00144AAA54|nr:ATP-dependent RNA helicase dbp6 [Arthroderma uncinatum]KAF3481047.1 ATP-dependent RNA helicase dbp6 [Arthroderma uncinatum]
MADIARRSHAHSASSGKHSRTENSNSSARKRKRHEDLDAPTSTQKKDRKKSSAAAPPEKRPTEGASSSQPGSEAQTEGNGAAGQHANPQENADEPPSRVEDKSHGRKSKKGSRDVADGPDKPSRKHEDRRTASKREPDTTTEERVSSEEKGGSSNSSANANGRTSKPIKHKKILSKYEKSKTMATDRSSAASREPRTQGQEDKESSEEKHGLVPLPQPAPAPGESTAPSYATLPPWLAAPSHGSSGLPVSFSDLGVGTRLVATLKDRGYTEALPVQSAVIPLLSKGSARHPGDVCVSAATGSGKTLAYVLPLFSALDRLPVAKLRAIIIVPTRELVKQVREACEICSSGSGLRIGTAVGSTALKDEQAQIMEQNRVYNPGHWRGEGYDDEMTARQWATFSLKDYVAEAEEYSKAPQNHVIESSPCVDILICTPGRLVDHIRSTKGFTLSHLEWLIIDEADRLLNESFQEWVDTVLPALETKEGSVSRGLLHQLSKGIRCPIESRRLQKVILSATMTRDISKLNSLRLQNPKLVAVDGADKAADGLTGSDNNIALPSRLNEVSIPVGDGSEKPLYLLKLLESSIGIVVAERTRSKKSRTSISPDSSDSTSSDSSDTSDSSDSDSSSSASSQSDEDSSDSDSDSDSSASSSSSTSPNKQVTPQSSVLIFTKSSEAASRLSRLLALMCPLLDGKIGTLIKSNKSSTSRRVISAYRKGKMQIIIATDRASRGLDLPLLGNVVNYDVPNSLTTYVHRVGRTARAGQSGSAWTLVTHSEGRWFTNEIARGGMSRAPGMAIKKVALRLDDDDRAALKGRYEKALKQLEVEVAGHRKGANKT